MNKIKQILFGILLLFAGLVNAQQSEVYNQFFMNPYLYNAAYAGVEGHTVFYALYQKKWANIDGAPQISNVAFHTPLKGGIGIGAMVFNDNYGIINKSLGKLSASYLVTIDREHHLRFGMSVGGGTQGINFGELDDPSDPAFQSVLENSSFMVADFGATYHFDHFNVGFSIPNLIGYNVFQGESFAPVRVTPLDNIMFKINYRGHINHDIAIEPHLIYRYSNHLPDQLEATVIFHIYHVVWAGATYRQNNTYAATFGAKIKEKIAVGYGYELGNLSISSLTGPTHEVHIGFHLGTKKEHAAHVSSFIKSHQLTTEQRAALAAKEREEKLQELQASRPNENPQSDALGIVKTTPAKENNSDALGIVKTSTTPKEEPKEDPWKVDQSKMNATRTNPFGEKEKAIVIKHVNQEGETVYAVAWEPVDEDWELIDDAPPIQRQSTDGTTEIGVKYYRQAANGSKELIVKWEPVVNEEQVDALLKSESTEEVIAQQVDDQTNNKQQESELIIPPTSINNTNTQSRDVVVNQPQEPVQQTTNNTTSSKQPEPQVTQTPTNTSDIKTQETVVTKQPVAEPDPTPTQQIVTNQTTQKQEDHPEAIERSKGNENLTNDFRSHDEIADSNEHLQVTRGNNMLELPSGFYLVAGVFEEYEHAESLSDDLFPKGYHDVIVGYLSARGYYYTVISRHNSLSEANNAKARVRQRSGMSKVWVLQVND